MFCQNLGISTLLVLILSAEICSNNNGTKLNNTTRITSYNERYAKLLAILSAAAYSKNPNVCVNRWMPKKSMWHVYSLSTVVCDKLEQTCGTYTVVSEHRRELVMVFRGTKTNEQMMLEGWASFMSKGVNFHGIGKVNKYFNEALESVWPMVEIALKEPNYMNYTVTFTGHSLGGALAALAAAQAVLLKLRSNKMVKLYTFGEPRIGNSEFAFKHDELVTQSYRVVFRKDMIPHLPPCLKDTAHTEEENKPCDPKTSGASGIAYHHGTEIWYPNEMPLLESNSPSTEEQHYYECVGKQPKDEDFSCSDSVVFEIGRYKAYFWDHRHYFGHRLPVFGQLGCDPKANDEDDEAAQKMQTVRTQTEQKPTEEKPADEQEGDQNESKLDKFFNKVTGILANLDG